MVDSAETGIMRTAAVYGALILAASVYGGWALVAKIAMQDGADPMVYAFYRCFGGTLLLFSVMLIAPNLACSHGTNAFQKVRSVPQDDLIRFAMLGFFLAANVSGFILGASKLSALTCSIFQPTIPVFAMIFSVIFGVEQISKHKFAGVLCMIVGAMCVAAFGESARGGGAADNVTLIAGLLFILINVSATGLYLVHNKDIVRTYEPVFATAMSYFFAACMILVGTLVKVGLDNDKWMLGGSQKAWLGLIYAVGLTTALNYSLLAWANKQSTPVVTSCAATMQPLAAATLSLAILGIGFSTGQVAGAAFIMLGLLCVVRGQVLEAHEQERTELINTKEKEKGLA